MISNNVSLFQNYCYIHSSLNSSINSLKTKLDISIST